ncbi:alpha/beta hydrolase [Mycobacterium sp. WUMAC-067]|uniref:alpha/beta hydrolase n=1 Tax=unclassified Mycobacterium TaxID=2642494 RepID=UPI001CDA0CC8|nr:MULTISPECIES: alpha/beta hydrolase [unclassified Mycobacterium]MCA2244675.1 alpha/beta hydrolase [Mycobacterium sp. WUMAC-067]MCA2315566.1 alpha/beta hydrolase [Mycobacterium sp. WUMAC-025]
MSLDPQIAAILPQLDGGFPPVQEMSGAEARALIRSRLVPPARPEPVAAVADRSVEGQGGPIPVRVYRPEAAGPVPILVYAHGGGFVFCDLDSHDGLCRNIANLVPAVVVSVDYRLAPENPWPAAVEDVYAVTCWAYDNAGSLGADPERLVVGGDSAGGNLAAVTAIMARDRGGPAPAAQLLLYPVIAADFDTESYRLFGRGFYNPKPALQWYWDCYLPSREDRAHPYAAPLSADLRGVPPAVVVVAGHDPLRDEGLAYAGALTAAGVPTRQLCYHGGIHGFMTMPMLDIAHRARKEAAAALSDLLQR